MKKLYFYSTISWYENRIKLGEEPWLKIGGSAVQTVEDRINQQDTTSNPEPLICLGEFDVDFDDTDFHEHLDDNGYVRSREDKHREFYNTTVEQAKYELEKYSIKINETVLYNQNSNEIVCKNQNIKEKMEKFLKHLI